METSPILPLKNLSERHLALTSSLAGSYLEAAGVSLDRHHTSPKEFIVENDGTSSVVTLVWDVPDDRTKAAWANSDDATRDGAYAVAIAAIELLRGLFAIRRAETRTGADYYISAPGQDLEDLENWFRLEVSGTHAEKNEVKRRLRIKITQTQKGKSNLPAIAAIVGFRVQLILLQAVK